MKLTTRIFRVYLGFFGLICFISTQSLQAQCTLCTTTISTNSSASVEVDGALAKLCITGGTFTGSLTLKNGAGLCIATGATFSPSSFTINGGSIVDNHGTWNSRGFTLGFTLNNYGAMTISGSMTINSTGSLTSSGSSLSITGSLQVDGDLDITGDASVGGAMQINGSGNVTLNDGELTVAGSFGNNGTVSASGSSNCGQISVGGASTNQGNYGTDGSNLDICDASAADDGFDTNNGTVGGSVSNCTCAATLPVELISFDAKRVNDHCLIQWRTIQEENSSHFVVERSLDGYYFNSIGSVAAKGNSNVLVEYELADHEIQNRTVYYRLKQVDLDGATTF